MNKELLKDCFFASGKLTDVAIKSKQPRGGYLPIKIFEQKQFEGDIMPLNENVHYTFIGMAVDYLTRYQIFGNKEDAFHISELGVNAYCSMYGHTSKKKQFNKDLARIKGLDDESIISALNLVKFDSFYRAGILANTSQADVEIVPDDKTLTAIRELVNRSVNLIKSYGNPIDKELVFEGAYNSVIMCGDADYLVDHTLIDLKVSIKEPTNKHTLQIFLYYLLAHYLKDDKDYSKIDQIAIVNPRLNKTYTLKIKDIDPDIYKFIEDGVKINDESSRL